MNDVDPTAICVALIGSVVPLAALWLRLSFQLRRQRQHDRHTAGMVMLLGSVGARRIDRVPRREHTGG